ATGGAEHRAGIYSTKAEEVRLHLVAGGLPLPSRAQELLAETTEEAKLFTAKQVVRQKLVKLDLSPLSETKVSLFPPPTEEDVVVALDAAESVEELSAEEVELDGEAGAAGGARLARGPASTDVAIDDEGE
ncbi:MAG: hypothetical protein HY744_08120, partial [Deltaproteobacteria bacterium]|nr:hypothetical protein [Deltaproteobacteria bacterium]